MTILPNLAQENEALKQKLADMQAMLIAASKPRALSMKVSEKGCASVYGLNTRGIHLYASQWLRIFEQADQIKAFIETNRSLLAWKAKD
jgi:uncharacterized protein YigA (DUF484 family)